MWNYETVITVYVVFQYYLQYISIVLFDNLID